MGRRFQQQEQRKARPIGIGCDVVPQSDGRYAIMPKPSFKGERRHHSDGEYFGQGRFSVTRNPRGDRLTMRRPEEEDDTPIEPEIIGVVSRDISYYYLVSEYRDGVFNAGGGNVPDVGGAFPSVIGLAEYPGLGGVDVGVDPALNTIWAPHPWPISGYTDDPYYPPGGFWVTGDAISAPVELDGHEDLPDRENLSVTGPHVVSDTIDAIPYEWTFLQIGVREWRYESYTWEEWMAL